MGDAVTTMVRERHADIDVVAVTGDPPDGVRADVFFGGYGNWGSVLPWLDAAGVQWVQLSGTGADRVPADVFAGRTVTCARGASAGPIAEFVIGAVLAQAKRFPQIWLDDVPRHWNFPTQPMDVVEGRTL